MKLTTNTNISVDGVMQGLGGPEEDPTGGFERGGWAMPFFGGETEALISQVYGVIFQVYRTAGRPQYATATADRNT